MTAFLSRLDALSRLEDLHARDDAEADWALLDANYHDHSGATASAPLGLGVMPLPAVRARAVPEQAPSSAGPGE